jgi:prepilin-type processing-associated H-X9-DG protein
MTFMEVLVVVFYIAVVASMLLPIVARSKWEASKVNCISNLKQDNLAFRIWEEDNTNQYPMAVSVTNGGAMELIQKGNASAVFRVMSNELSTTKILLCPEDPDRTFATNWNSLNGSHISYFVSANASEEYPQMILDGDDDLVIAGKRAKAGLLALPANAPISWSGTRHKFGGNIGLADGSVEQQSSSGLQNAIQYSLSGTLLLTNRIAIP